MTTIAAPGIAATPGTGKYEKLLERCESLAPIPTAVAYPCEATALTGAVEAFERGLVTPTLFGPTDLIHETADAAGADISQLEGVDAATGPAAAAKAVGFDRTGRAGSAGEGGP